MRERRRRPVDETIDYKNIDLLMNYVSSRGRIMARRGGSASSAKHHRAIAKAIKRARALGLMPFVSSQRFF